MESIARFDIEQRNATMIGGGTMRVAEMIVLAADTIGDRMTIDMTIKGDAVNEDEVMTTHHQHREETIGVVSGPTTTVVTTTCHRHHNNEGGTKSHLQLGLLRSIEAAAPVAAP